jgi:FMN-dependent NADH-azoreductase
VTFDYLLPTPSSRKVSRVDELLAATRSWHPRPGGLPHGRTAVLMNARGGSYQPATPRDGWDHAEPYLRRVLAEVLGLDRLVITPELTLTA